MTVQSETSAPTSPSDEQMDQIVEEEERVLARVARTLASRQLERRGPAIDYDAELLALRDQINEARLEDVPPLIEEMERLQQVAARRAQVTESHVDVGSPYFGHLVLQEDEQKREVLIGRGTFLDSRTGIRIVDWRDAPVSRVYYRYDEGDDFEENFGGRRVEGDVLVRRSVAITAGQLRRVVSPQGTFLQTREGWRRASDGATRLRGGAGAAMRPEAHHRPGRLGIGRGDGREDKHLSEITALIDARQFDLISKPTSGLVVIQGGAGSGKTTIGLHRLAYLAFQEPARFRPERMLVVVFNDALARYISRVLPALGIQGVSVTTYEGWAHKLRVLHVERLPKEYADGTPAVVSRLKKHPAMLRVIDEHVAALVARVDAAIVDAGSKHEGGGKALRVWRSTTGQPPAFRVEAMVRFLRDEGAELPLATRHVLERALDKARAEAADVISAWAEILTSGPKLFEALSRLAPGSVDAEDFDEFHQWCRARCAEVLAFREAREQPVADDADEPEPRDAAEPAEDDETGPVLGVDGALADDETPPTLDREDDTLLLRLVQAMRGPLRRRRDVLRYEHVFVDEAQDLSPVELAVVVDTVSDGQSITLAGDVAQRIMMDNGFTDWRRVLADLGLAHVEVEPLRVAYRSTEEIVDFAGEVLGPLRPEEPGRAIRRGAPVELFRFAHSGDAVGFLAEALRELMQSEPLCSVAVIARYPEQAELYAKGLLKSEVPYLRLVADQDFPFRPGVDVTDVKQVKGLEFDYVILLEVSTGSYPADDESRHLLHIAATRAAHQLWVSTSGEPSLLLPDWLRSRGY